MSGQMKTYIKYEEQSTGRQVPTTEPAGCCQEMSGTDEVFCPRISINHLRTAHRLLNDLVMARGLANHNHTTCRHKSSEMCPA